MTKEIKRAVYYKDREINFTLTYKKVKNINLRIKLDGSISVSASKRVSLKYIDEFVLSKADFILSALNKFSSYKQDHLNNFKCVNGAKLCVQGRELTIRILEGSKNEAYEIDDALCVFSKSTNDIALGNKILNNYLDKKARELFVHQLNELYPIFIPLEVKMPVLKIRDMKTRWGSCAYNKNTITLNKQLLYKPKHLLNYVIIHELCHFIHPNHSKDFYNLLESILPNWKAFRQELRNKC